MCMLLWPNVGDDDDVIFVVDYVVIDVVIVVICVCCDDCVHGKLLEVISDDYVAGCTWDCCCYLGCVMVARIVVGDVVDVVVGLCQVVKAP